MCSNEPGVGSQLVNWVKDQARKNNILYLALSALHPVVTYYWLKHSFQVSTGCESKPKVKDTLAKMLGAYNAKRKLEVQIQQAWKNKQKILHLVNKLTQLDKPIEKQ
jgi:hypothetical protein